MPRMIIKRQARRDADTLAADILAHFTERGPCFAQALRALGRSIECQDDDMLVEACYELIAAGKLVCEKGQYHLPPSWFM